MGTAHRLATFAVSCLASLLAIGATAPAAELDRPLAGGDVIEGRYIVVYEDSAGRVARQTNQRERRLGFRADLRYRHALRGFAARLEPAQVRKLRRDPEVELVSPDRRVEIAAEVPLAPGETAPTGVRRILAATDDTARQPSGVGVAVLDTGIQLSHPDLNATHGTNCITPGPANDGHGHGTHVAGTVAARNDGAGVVGVAPGTEVHAVKVLADTGDGSSATVICGIDWVTANHATLGIGVANLSLSGVSPFPLQSCESTLDPEHQAICNSTAAGVNYVVAAGNASRAFDDPLLLETPAAYPEVLTAAAAADSDGLPGGFGPPGCHGDDAAGSFSNFAQTAQGAAHTIAAPGSCILSTWIGGGHQTSSGTSMASPHVAGVVALCIDEGGAAGPCAGKTPPEVIDLLRSDAAAYSAANPGYGFAGDPATSPAPNRHYGFLTRVLPPPSAPPTPVNTSPPGISGATNHGQTLQASSGAWTGQGPIAFSYRWRRCEPSGSSCVAIPGASGPSYELGDADLDQRLRATVFARNAGGTTNATSAPSALVGPPLPPAPPGNAPAGDADPAAADGFRLGKLRLWRKRGMARLVVRVPGPGRVLLRRTKRVRPAARRSEAAGRVRLRVRPRGKARRRVSKRRCRRSGKNRLRTRVGLRVTYRPAGGEPETERRRAKLVRRC